ncbi:teichoic acid export protein ATP-binding subunit [Planococcus salinarum]|uniref:Teichoic acid export protein ATP-binding subunit n=1 Tax=Planococcus salinarum TaxID=622695 RepID=A0ABX3CXT8_9BACL|nr:teichoic acids export ABC transporter ATP-binding subunit TagH [Planococcus salinarum]OHX49750.1 teichoic acid export protein ATP-binding subunit [Planococcus salinarum]TAA72777.1 teichoic acids export ABC transporter ATP-binding subunit TagH [Planococcus salinarum]
MSNSVEVHNVSKRYKLYKKNSERLLDLLIPHKEYGEAFYALQDVSFNVEKGSIVGLVGINGSGKSTLANVIAGVIPATGGHVVSNGNISLIAVNAGLDNKLTGRENVELKLLMLGFSKTEINAMEEEIIEFAELEKFIDQPVKTYSSGMKSRLGFSISVRVNPDILIIDEALSVGDKAFAEKSLSKMMEFKEQGKTMFFVSHSISQMRKFCEKILWLEFGVVKEYGPASEVLAHYEEFLEEFKNMSKKEKKKYRQNALDRQSKIGAKS